MAEATMEIPISKIQEMKSQGMSNNQIIDTLQKQGFSSSQIFDSLSASDAPPPEPAAPAMPPPTMPTPTMPPNMPPPMMGSMPASDNEELIEAIIDEKWNDLMSDINKVIAWKEVTESRVTQLEQQLKDTKDQFEKLHQAVVGKVGEYDQHILEVGAEVKAMEKVFSKVLPVFTDNVAELSRITDKMKPKKKV